MHLTHLLFLAVSAASSTPSSEPSATVSEPVVVVTQDAGASPHQEALNEYPQRIADRPLTIGAGLFQFAASGSYSFFQAQDLNGGQGGANLGGIPSIQYGVSDPLELNLLGIKYKLADDGRNWPGVAVRMQLHDLAWYPQLAQYKKYPYPILRPGVFLDFRDRLPAHLTAIASLGYVFSVIVGDWTDGSGPIPKGQNVATQTAPFLLGLEYSPWNPFSFVLSGGYLLDAQSTAANQQCTTTTPCSLNDITASLAFVWTPNNRFDLRVFGRGNWFQGSPGYGYVPELGLAFSFRL